MNRLLLAGASLNCYSPRGGASRIEFERIASALGELLTSERRVRLITSSDDDTPGVLQRLALVANSEESINFGKLSMSIHEAAHAVVGDRRWRTAFIKIDPDWGRARGGLSRHLIPQSDIDPRHDAVTTLAGLVAQEIADQFVDRSDPDWVGWAIDTMNEPVVAAAKAGSTPAAYTNWYDMHGPGDPEAAETALDEWTIGRFLRDTVGRRRSDILTEFDVLLRDTIQAVKEEWTAIALLGETLYAEALEGSVATLYEDEIQAILSVARQQASALAEGTPLLRLLRSQRAKRQASS